MHASFASNNSAGVILNETAVRQLELETHPLGEKLHTFGGVKPNSGPDTDKVLSWTIIGVVEDFHFASLKEPVKPLALFLNHNNGSVSGFCLCTRRNLCFSGGVADDANDPKV